MKTDRRGFLGALLCAPLLRQVPAPPLAQGLRANVWTVPPPPTEADFVYFLEETRRWNRFLGAGHLICSPAWVEAVESMNDVDGGEAAAIAEALDA